MNVNIPDQTRVQFFVTCTSGDEVWESKFNLTFGAPNFNINNISNTELLPGGPGTITFEFTNNGGADAQDVVLQVISSSDDITLENNTYEIENIAVGQTAIIPVDLNVEADVEVGATYEINYLITSGH